MSLLQLYDPPARMTDFDLIRGQRLKWHQFLVEQFTSQIGGVQDALAKVANGRSVQSQFYDATNYDPGGGTVEQAVVWNAFPKELLRRFGRERALKEADRLWPLSAYSNGWIYDSDNPALDFAAAPSDRLLYRPTVEYCEWHVNREPATGHIVRVAFTSEPPEYWFALAGGTMDQSTVDFPGDMNLLLDLYRRHVDPSVHMEELLAPATYKSPLGLHKQGEYDPYNKWNTTHGAMHLCAPPNSLGAEINLAAFSTLLYEDEVGALVVDPDALIAGAALGGPNRNSDPTIAATVNVLARLGAQITLANPVGLYMDHIDLSGWEAPGGVAPTDCVRVVRGEPNAIERLEVRYPTDEFAVSDIRIGGVPIRYGGQIAECITVKLVGAAAAIGSISDAPRSKLTAKAYVDPTDARAVFYGRGRPLAGLARAFAGESTEVEPPAASVVAQVGRRR
jgi:hypothetical protein